MFRKLIYPISFMLLLVLILTSTTSAALVGWWKLDDGSGTIATDNSGNERHCTLVNGPQWVEGKVGGALEFAGDGDYVEDEVAEVYLNGLSAVSVAMWIKSDVVGTDSGFIIFANPSGNDQQNIRYDADGGEGDINLIKYGMAFTSGNEEDESSANIQTTDWQHIAVTTASGAGLKLYINGMLDIPSEDDASVTGVIVGCTTLIIGKGGKDESDSAGWAGLIDDIRIYNRVLSSAEIAWLGGVIKPFDKPF